MSNMEKTGEKKLRDAQADLRKSKEEISRLQYNIKEMKASASLALHHFDSVVATLESHIRQATMQLTDYPFSFKFTMEQIWQLLRTTPTLLLPAQKYVCL